MRRILVFIKNISHNIFMFFADDEYFGNALDVVGLKYVKLIRYLRKFRIYQFLFKEEIETNEL